MIKRFMSSVTGLFVSKEHAKANPDTTFAYTDKLSALDAWLEAEIEQATAPVIALAYNRVRKEIAKIRKAK